MNANHKNGEFLPTTVPFRLFALPFRCFVSEWISHSVWHVAPCTKSEKNGESNYLLEIGMHLRQLRLSHDLVSFRWASRFGKTINRIAHHRSKSALFRRLFCPVRFVFFQVPSLEKHWHDTWRWDFQISSLCGRRRNYLGQTLCAWFATFYFQ